MMLVRGARVATWVWISAALFTGGCGPVHALPESGSYRDVLRSLARAEVPALEAPAKLLGAEMTPSRPCWGLLYLPSYDAFIYVLRDGDAIGGYALLNRRALSRLIIFHARAAWETNDYPCFSSVSLAGDKLEGKVPLEGQTLRVMPTAILPQPETPVPTVLTSGGTVVSAIRALATTGEAVLGLPQAWTFVDKSVRREFYGPYHLASCRTDIFILQEGGRVMGYAFVARTTRGLMEAWLDMGGREEEVPCYSRMSVSSGGVTGEGELPRSVMVRMRQEHVSAPPGAVLPTMRERPGQE